VIQSNLSQADPESVLKQLHERSNQPIGNWLRAPAHVHYKAFRMSDPPTQRPASRTEFQSLLSHLKVPAETTYVRENFGYSVKETKNGERLIVLWQARTEYYNYQLWHVPSQASSTPTFGSLQQARGVIARRFQVSKSGPASVLEGEIFARVPVNAHDEKPEERRIPANLRRGIELTELALALHLVTFQHPSVAFFNVGFLDRAQKTCALLEVQQE